MVKYYWIFGGIAGVTSVVLEVLLFGGYLGYDKTMGVLIGKYLALLICIIFAIILIKKIKGSISFLRTSFSGLMIALICSAISGLGFAWMSYPDGEFFKPAQEYMITEWKKTNADNPDELVKIEEVRENVKEKFSIRNHTFFDLTGYIIAGMLFSTLMAAFVADRSSLKG